MGTDREEILRARLAAAAKAVGELRDHWRIRTDGDGDETLVAEINDVIRQAGLALDAAQQLLARHLVRTA